MENNNHNKKQVVIILGPPGAGKGTQGKLVADELSLYYFETSKILERKVMSAKDNDFVEVNGKKYSLTEERKFWKTGKLLSPPLVSFWVKREIKKLHEQGEGLLLSGSPRTLTEGEQIMPLLKDLYGQEKIKVVLLELSEEDSIWRNSHRRICSLMRHPILYNEETADLTMCPLDGSKLLKREGLDDVETIKRRLKEYKGRTLPLVGFLKERGFGIKIVDGAPSPAVVFEDILKQVAGQ